MGEGKKVSTTVYLRVDQDRRLKALAWSLDVSVASLIRDGIDLVLDKRETPPGRFSAQQKKRAIDLYQAGYGAADVARQVRCRKSTVYRWLRAAGIERRSHAEALALLHEISNEEELAAEAVRLYAEEGLSVVATGERIGYSAPIIRRWLVDAGVTIRGSHRYSKSAREEALRLYQQGIVLSEIEDATGVPAGTVSRWAREAGLPKRI